MNAVIDGVTDDIIDAISITGAPDKVREQIKRYDGVLGLPTIYAPGTGLPVARRKEMIESSIAAFVSANG